MAKNAVPQGRIITCPNCDVTGDIAGPIFEFIKPQIDAGLLGQLLHGLETGSIEVSLALSPRMRSPLEGDNKIIEVYYPICQGLRVLRYTLHFPLQSNTRTYWVLHIYNREEAQIGRTGHSALIFYGSKNKKAVQVALTLDKDDSGAKRPRLRQSVLNKKEFNALREILQERFLFKGLGAETPVYFHRFISACAGNVLGDSAEDIELKQRHEVHHHDHNPLHNCISNLGVYQQCIHATFHSREEELENRCKASIHQNGDAFDGCKDSQCLDDSSSKCPPTDLSKLFDAAQKEPDYLLRISQEVKRIIDRNWLRQRRGQTVSLYEGIPADWLKLAQESGMIPLREDTQ